MRHAALFALFTTMISLSGCVADDEMFDDAGGEPLVSTESNIVLEGYTEPSYDEDDRASILSNYDHLDQGGVVPRDLLEDAVLFFHANKARLDNRGHLSVVDFSRHSSDKRFFLVDMKSGAVDAHVVAHGSGSDPSYTGTATKFSNVQGSNASSLGYYVTGETYSGKNGRSLRLDGVSSTNSNARSRAVVVHGASYVSEGREKQGRSWGCPALPQDVKDEVIDAIKDGSVLYIGVSRGDAAKGSASSDKTSGASSDKTSGASSDKSGTSASGVACRNHGECNPGNVGSGTMCVSGRCVPGCLTDWMCPGTCDVARKQCR